MAGLTWTTRTPRALWTQFYGDCIVSVSSSLQKSSSLAERVGAEPLRDFSAYGRRRRRRYYTNYARHLLVTNIRRGIQ